MRLTNLLVGFSAILILIFPSHSAETTARKASSKANVTSLEYVHVIWRHGDRTPGGLLNHSDASKWPEGIGELTKKGTEQQFRLGKWLRERYGGWLGEKLDRNAIYIRSSDYNRTLMSALANMAGMFPPTSTEGLAPSLMWQPVPVHTMPRPVDKELYEEIKCLAAEDELKKQWRSIEADTIRKEFEVELSFFAEKLGRTELDLRDIWLVYDNYYCELCNSKTWPQWLNQSTFSRLVRLYNDASKLEFRTDLLRRLRGGTLLQEIFERFASKVNGDLGNSAKYYAYSAHDATMAALLSTMGLFYETYPLYATALMLEMHKTEYGGRVIRVFHKNETDKEDVFELEVPSCGYPCTMEKFHQEMGRFFPNDWDRECGNQNRSFQHENTIALQYTAIAILWFSTIVFFALYIKEKLALIQMRNAKRREAGDEKDTVMLLHSDEEEEDGML